ncbi:MAG TPA: cytochrome b/b6 domain-containing protein [Allosphingosinicella sp.]|nr:cytochrome b/b6 domain-containing protein [Allosphingosinicella sp.]
MPRSTPEPTVRVAVWDRAVRIVHWLLAGLIGLAWWTAEEEMVEWHDRIGMTILGLLIFRIVWGFIGSSTARFASFVRGPAGILEYLRGRSGYVLGHNPLGALSVLALLAAVGLQAGLGLFAADEDGFLAGPLSGFVSEDTAETLTGLHKDVFDWLLVLIGLHVAAIAVYLFVKRDNLIGPMITGRRPAPEGTQPMVAAPGWRALVAALIAFAAVSVIWYAGGGG